MPEPSTERMLGILAGELRRSMGYAARREINDILRWEITDPLRLEPYGRKVYSQNDEDGIIEEIFRRLDLGPRVGTFVEIGVETGLECNSLYLLHKGWRGTWIELDKPSARQIEATFSSLMDSRRLKLARAKATPENINALIGTSVIDFLSIDIDGMDIYLLEALIRKPRVICIEYNSKFPPPLSKVPVYDPDYQWSGTDYMGASLTAINDVAEGKGYCLVGTNITGSNAFFVRKDLVKNGGVFAAGGVEALYNPPRYWLTFDAFTVGHRAGFGRYVDLEQKEEPRLVASSG